jgi:hypothetical protein
MIRRASIVLTVTIGAGLILATAQAPSEYQLKAALIYNFAKFVEWPSTGGTDEPIVIGILGDDPFGQDFEAVTNGKTANGKRVILKRFPNLQSLTPCHILFIGNDQKPILGKVLVAAGSNVLTVGEMDRFAENGGMIHMKLIAGKVRFVITNAAAERAGIRISAKLLSIAQVIRN